MERRFVFKRLRSFLFGANEYFRIAVFGKNHSSKDQKKRNCPDNYGCNKKFKYVRFNKVGDMLSLYQSNHKKC